MRMLKFLFIISGILFLAKVASAPSFMDIGQVVESATKQQETEGTSSEQKKEETSPTPQSKEMNQEEWRPPHDVHQVTESYEMAFIKTIGVLVGLLVLVILTVWMFRKMSRGRVYGTNVLKSIKILEKRSLSPKSILYLIEVRGKEILIVESQLDVRNIALLDE